MALAVGILVDDSDRRCGRTSTASTPIGQTRDPVPILDGAAEIAVPAFVSTLCICIVFLSRDFDRGSGEVALHPARHGGRLRDAHFVLPLAHAGSHPGPLSPFQRKPGGESGGHNPIAWMSSRVERGFERLREAYGRALQLALHHKKTFSRRVRRRRRDLPVLASAPGARLLSHRRCRPDTPPRARSCGHQDRGYATLFGAVEERVRAIVPRGELDTITDNIGTPVSGINLVLGDPSMIGSADGEMLVSLAPKHRPTGEYVKALAARPQREVSASDVLLPGRR